MLEAKSIENKAIVQAIVIADSYNANFEPFTSTNPLALLPIANVPLVEYMLETLNRNGFEEVIVFCGNHIEKVKRYIIQRQANRCTWSVNMKVMIIGSASCRSIGEALRDLDARNIVRGNVLLVGVDSLTNADLAALLDEHKRLSKRDRGAVMTVVYTESVRRMRTGNEVVIAMEPKTRRLLYHRRLGQDRERTFEVRLDLLVANRDVAVSHGLLDPQIAICSHATLPLFADNFDFLTRDDFVRSVLIHEDILNSRIYVAKMANEEYAMRVNNWQSFHLVNLDVINRRLYSLVPDRAVSECREQYKHFRNNIYRHQNMQLSRTCDLDGDLVLGEESEICEGTYLRKSVVGRGCRIRRNCRISNSFLMDGVVVGDGCVLDHCIMERGVTVGEGCTINPGTVLGEIVEIPNQLVVTGHLLQATKPPDAEWAAPIGRDHTQGPRPAHVHFAIYPFSATLARLRKRRRVSFGSHADLPDHALTSIISNSFFALCFVDASTAGPNFFEFLYAFVVCGQVVGAGVVAAIEKIADRAYTIPVVKEHESDTDDDNENMDQRAPNQPIAIAPVLARYPPSVYVPSDDECDESGTTSPISEDANIFLSEVIESLKRGLADRTNPEYLILEINSSRYAYNMTLCEVNYNVVKAIIQIMLQQDGVATNTISTLRRLLAYFGAVFRNYIRDREAMMDCLKAFEEMCLASETLRTKIAQLVHYLYEQDLIGEEVILAWYDKIEDETIKTTLLKLVKWLLESSEDEEED